MNYENLGDIYRKYQRFSVNIANSMVRNIVIAEDISHDVFLSLLKTTKELDFSVEDNVRSLIFAATVNKTKDYFKKASVRWESASLNDEQLWLMEPEAPGENPELKILQKEERKYRQMVLAKLKETSPMNYDIYLKTRVYGLSSESVAKEYHISSNNVNNRNMRTSRWLHRQLEKLYEQGHL
jgi:RNA polymerase sigma factor (sigma-70 family)